MMAPSGVGKSYLADYIVKTHEDSVVISRDKIRAAVQGKKALWNKDIEKQTKRNYYQAISKMLKTHKVVIADATHLTVKSRKELFENISIPGNTEIIGVWIESSLNTALKQNAARPESLRVPEDRIQEMFKYAVSPRNWEPFDFVSYIMRESDIGISGKQLDLKNTLDILSSL